MAENSKIEWTDHIDRNATGRVLGAYKSAATKTGCSIEVWMDRRLSGQKWCFRCKSWKSVAEFTADNSRKGCLTSSCRPCTSEASTASRYGMTVSEFRAFRDKHGEQCGICCAVGLLYVDHCHNSGKARGFLCPSCNSAIGLFREDPALFTAAIKYLETHRG